MSKIMAMSMDIISLLHMGEVVFYGILIFSGLWIGIISPLRAEARRTLSAIEFQNFIASYRNIKRFRAIGVFFCCLGFLTLCFFLPAYYLPIESSETPDRIFISFLQLPTLLLFIGIHCFHRGYLHAFSSTLKP